MRFMGCDVSLNHGALVTIDEVSDEPISYHVYGEKPALAKTMPNHSTRILLEKGDGQMKDLARLDFLELLYQKQLSKMTPDYVAIENYAFDATGRSYQIGEAGGALRLAAWRRDLSIRLHDPGCVKMYAAWDGHADKGMVCASVYKRWGLEWSEHGEVAEGDMADAYVLARLARTEWQLRTGILTLDMLEHDKERQVFLRTTKEVPTNILGRDWLQRP